METLSKEEIDAKLREYAAVKAEIKRLEKQVEKLGPKIREIVTEHLKSDKVETDFGSFTISTVNVWKYSKAVTDAEEVVDKIKAEEKANGVATATPRYDLKFTAPKPAKTDE